MFCHQNTNRNKDEFLEQAKVARQERAQEKKRDAAATCIQALVRGFLMRQKLKRLIKAEVCSHLSDFDETSDKPKFIPAVDMFKLIRKFKLIFKEDVDKEKFEKLCRYLIASMNCENQKYCYVMVALNKSYAVGWIQQLKAILWQCCVYLKQADLPQDSTSLNLYLHMLVTFTSPSTWKLLKSGQGESLKMVLNQLCTNVLAHLVSQGLYANLHIVLLKGLMRSKPSLKHATLLALINLSLRPLLKNINVENVVNLFLLHIFSVPALLHHISIIAPECLELLKKHNIMKTIISDLKNEQNTRIIFNALECNYGLCLLANILHLSHFDNDGLIENQSEFVNVVTRLLESCQRNVVNKQSNLTHWHPVLGWFAQSIDHGLHQCLPLVKNQLEYLWNSLTIKILFCKLNQGLGSSSPTTPDSPSCSDYKATSPTNILSPSKSLFRKTFDQTWTNYKISASKSRKFNPQDVQRVAESCQMYETAMSTLTQLKLDILTGLCYQSVVIINLWRFIKVWTAGSHMNEFIDSLTTSNNSANHEFYILVMFCDCATHLITILDDMEMYEQQRPFTLEDLVSMSAFLNYLIFKLIWNNLTDNKNIHNLFVSAHTLLMLLYKRDCRRPYTTADHWLIKEVKASTFIHDLEKNKKVAQQLMQKIPHLIPHKERVVLFRKYVNNEKAALGLTESACSSPQSTLITVHRSRIVEDGYQQLALLPSQALKGVIRVKFINEQGLDEAGIDQDGVFKEFLEVSITKVFDPSLNLFRVTNEERLYPSPTSYIHENHLSLFEFVGKLLGKAIYEGIVIDVPFASFFLSQVLGHQQTALYSSIDELPSLDSDLYKSLTYIKHYDGDVQNLDLTFSLDEDCMGQLVTYELIPGGKAISVTNENRISYIHLMAHFRMHMQIKEQTAAFLRGFRSIINPEWLTMFSTPELQRLISGDNTPVDIQDLRRHTKYFGGFHGNHRVIKWLWDLLEKDFTPDEHRLFLKFVTSCSKPPLLGFAHLEPPFSIRCVEVSDDQDTGDTVGSVLRGFLTIHKKDPVNRLPTSSTCFNVLKLPNYQKRSTLRDKLRYAITSNTGFELS